MAAPLLQVEGLGQLRRVLRRAGGKPLLAELKTTHRKIGDMVASRSRPAAPVRTGRLAATTRAGATQSGAVIRVGSARVPYAGPLHWGWPSRKIAPNPWVVDAAQSSEAAWVAVYEADLAKIIEGLSG